MFTLDLPRVDANGRELLYYLAAPYTSSDPKKCRFRQRWADHATCILLREGFQVFSPITFSAPLCTCEAVKALPHKRWMQLDITILRRCDHLLALKVPGWTLSKGMQEEINFFVAQHRPITYLELTHFEPLEKVCKRQSAQQSQMSLY